MSELTVELESKYQHLLRTLADMGSAATRSENVSQAGRGKIISEPSGCLVTVSWLTAITASTSR